MKIIDAADIMDIPYENAKAIYRIYKLEGRTTKKNFKKSDNKQGVWTASLADHLNQKTYYRYCLY